jgi:hypothetical protein
LNQASAYNSWHNRISDFGVRPPGRVNPPAALFFFWLDAAYSPRMPRPFKIGSLIYGNTRNHS